MEMNGNLTILVALPSPKDGNVRFRGLVEAHVPAYTKAMTKYQKSTVIADLIYKVERERPEGGFVKKEGGRWFRMGGDKVRDKVSHAIRKAAEKRRKGKNAKRIKQKKQDSLSVQEKWLKIITANALEPSFQKHTDHIDAKNLLAGSSTDSFQPIQIFETSSQGLPALCEQSQPRSSTLSDLFASDFSRVLDQPLGRTSGFLGHNHAGERRLDDLMGKLHNHGRRNYVPAPLFEERQHLQRLQQQQRSHDILLGPASLRPLEVFPKHPSCQPKEEGLELAWDDLVGKLLGPTTRYPATVSNFD